MFKPYYLWWQCFATQYLYLFRQHTHTQSILNIKSWAASQHIEQGLDREEFLLWPELQWQAAAHPFPSAGCTPLGWQSTEGTHTHTHRAPLGSSWGAPECLYSPPHSYLQSSWIPVGWGQACPVQQPGSLPCIILPSQTTYLVRSQCLIDVFLPKD